MQATEEGIFANNFKTFYKRWMGGTRAETWLRLFKLTIALKSRIQYIFQPVTANKKEIVEDHEFT